jgi:hypothetical protein
MKPINYSNTVMYKIVSKDLNSDLIYVGHTTNFRKRKSQHKENCNNLHYKKSNFKVYQMIRDNGGWNEWEMIEIEKFPCNDGNEAKYRERQLMEEFNANLNVYKSIVSKEEAKLRDKLRNQQNRDAINLTRQKWREKNREHENALAQGYREKNRDKINTRQREHRLEEKLKKALELENK